MISNPLRAGVYEGFSNPGVVAALLGSGLGKRRACENAAMNKGWSVSASSLCEIHSVKARQPAASAGADAGGSERGGLDRPRDRSRLGGVRRRAGHHHDAGSDLDAAKEIGHVLVGEPDA